MGVGSLRFGKGATGVGVGSAITGDGARGAGVGSTLSGVGRGAPVGVGDGGVVSALFP